MDVSIIIVTRDRAEDLRRTLDAMRAVLVPAGWRAELVVVDNGSSDTTPEVVRGASIPAMEIRYEREDQPGQSRGRNRGLAAASGQVILFTDDDVRPPPGWLADMCGPIAAGHVLAVAGGVKLAPSLLRPWMTPLHRAWLASTEWIERGMPKSMVGANMAFSRKVLEKVPAFDVETGPGASGFGDDGLFAMQLLAAGFQIHDAMDVCIEHHFEPSRLTRESWLSAARRRGESFAYIGHHWRHWGCRWGGARLVVATARLILWRAFHAGQLAPEGCTEKELNLVYHRAMVSRHLRESRRPRKYSRHGLVKLPV